MTRQKFIEEMEQLYGKDAYDYSEVPEIFPKQSKVTITCNRHHITMTQYAKFFIYRDINGCPECKIEKLTKDFVRRAKEIHGDKYDYSLVRYINAHTPVKIICPEHGEFEQIPYKHLNAKHGCPLCGGSSPHTNESFIEASKRVHGDRYDYSLVEYVNNRTKVKIICPEHGVFEQTPQSHLLGNGCHRCSGVRNTEEFIEASIKIHGNKYDYSLVEYVNTRTPVKIICPDHGVFEQTPTKHLCGHGCRSCKSAGLSKISENISQLLESNNIKFQKERIFEWMKRITYLRLDFYLPEYNIAIECHGLQHFEQIDFFGSLENIQNRDRIKFEQCKAHNIDIIYYAENSYDNYELGIVYDSTEDVLREIYKHSKQRAEK